MKKFTSLFCFIIISLLTLSTFMSCEEDNIDMDYRYFTVAQRQWEWNDLYNRFECVIPWTAIDEYIYSTGLVQAGVYVTEQVPGSSNKTYETLKTLPFVQTYADGPDNQYTETISFDIAIGAITFYIQTSDLFYEQGINVRDYEFKVNIVWNK